MDVQETIRARRSIRKFKKKRIPRPDLEELVDGARLAPSAANLQPLKYLVVDQSVLLGKVFSTLHWAAYLAPAGSPPGGHRPPAYIVVLPDTEIRETNYQWEVGAAVQNILLAALEKGIGTCWLLSINRPRLRKILAIPSRFAIDSLVALGYPDEAPRIVPLKKKVRYWKNRKGELIVPKRRLEDILFWNKWKE